VLSHISFSSDLKTRKERAIAVRDDNFFAVYQNLKAREFLEYVLNQYEKFGIEEFNILGKDNDIFFFKAFKLAFFHEV
jgi:type I restriction enzyme R subunit